MSTDQTTSLLCFPKNKFLQLTIFSYLPGCDLYHKIALLDKATRKQLPKTGLFDQVIIISLKELQDYNVIPMTSLLYALRLADSIQFQTDSQLIYKLTSARLLIEDTARMLSLPPPTFDIIFRL